MTGPIWPKVPAGFVRSVLAGHSSLGLFLAALAYLLCVTGTVAVLSDELRRWEQPHAPEFSDLAPQAMDRAAAAALAAAPGQTVKSLTVYLPTPDRPRAMVWLNGPKLERGWFLDAQGGLAREDRPAWNGFIGELHANLHLPGSWGYIIVGLVGVAMLGLAVSGLLAHPRLLRDAFRLRWGGSKRLQEADLHNRLSVWGLPFNVAVSLTGAYLGLVGVLVIVLNAVAPGSAASKAPAAVRGPVVAADPRPAPPLSLGAAAIASAGDEVKGRPFVLTLSRPGTRGQYITAYTLVDRRLVYGEMYHFAPDGRMTRVGWATGPVGAQMYASAYRLHFGSFGGLPVKALYVALGFGLCVVTSSGVAIWLARRRDQGRPAPRWDRIWTATAWGVLLATSVSALGAVAAGAPPMAVFWAALGASWAAGLASSDARVLGSRLKAALGASLAVLAGVHLAVNGTAALRPVPLTVDAACLAVALLFAADALRRRRAPTFAGRPAAAE